MQCSEGKLGPRAWLVGAAKWPRCQDGTANAPCRSVVSVGTTHDAEKTAHVVYSSVSFSFVVFALVWLSPLRAVQSCNLTVAPSGAGGGGRRVVAGLQQHCGLLFVREGEVAGGFERVRVVLTQHSLPPCEHVDLQFLGLGELALLLVRDCQVGAV